MIEPQRCVEKPGGKQLMAISAPLRYIWRSQRKRFIVIILAKDYVSPRAASIVLADTMYLTVL